MAEPKYVWELPIYTTLSNQLEVLIAQQNISQAYRTTLIDLKNYFNQAIYSIAGVDKPASPAYTAALIDHFDGNYSAYFMNKDPLGHEIKIGTKITMVDGTIFYIRQLVDESYYVPVIVENLGSDPFNQHPFYYSDAPILVDSNHYVSVPSIISNTIQTKKHIIDMVDESAVQPVNYMGREETVSTAVGDFLESVQSKYRSLNSVGFKSYRKFYLDNPYTLLAGAYASPAFFSIANWQMKMIGDSILLDQYSLKFTTPGVYRISVKLVIRALFDNSNFSMFMLDNKDRIENIDTLVALVTPKIIINIGLPVMVDTTFDVVVTENKLDNFYTFFYCSNNNLTIGGNPLIFDGHEVPYATSIEVIKIQ